MEFFFICLCVSTKDSVRPQLFLFSSAVNAKESCSCFVFFPTGPKEEMQHIYNSGSIYNTIVCKHGLTCPSSYSFAHVFLQYSHRGDCEKPEKQEQCPLWKQKKTDESQERREPWLPPTPPWTIIELRDPKSPAGYRDWGSRRRGKQKKRRRRFFRAGSGDK